MKKIYVCFYVFVACLLSISMVGCSSDNDSEKNPEEVTLGITSFSPMNGIAGDEIEILGVGFGSNPAAIELTINGEKLEIMEISPTKLKAKLPSNEAGSYSIKISVGGNSAESKEQFTYDEVTDITFEPAIGESGTVISVRGAGFSTEKEKNIVKINGKIAEVLSATANELKVVAPNNEEDTSYPIEVEVNGKSQTSKIKFKYGHFDYKGFTEIKGFAAAETVAFSDESTLIFGTYDGSKVTKVHYLKLNAPDKLFEFCAQYTEGTHAQTGRIKMMQPYGDKIYFAYYRDNIIGVCDLKGANQTVKDLGITGLQAPADIKFDAVGNMYVLGVDNQKIFKFTKDNYTGAGESFINFDIKLACMDFDWDGNLIVAGKDNKLYRVVGNKLSELDSFDAEIISVMVDPQKEDIYISCANKNIFLIRNGQTKKIIVNDVILYGMKMSPTRDGIYAGATYHHSGAIIKIPISLEYSGEE